MVPMVFRTLGCCHGGLLDASNLHSLFSSAMNIGLQLRLMLSLTALGFYHHGLQLPLMHPYALLGC